MSLALSDPAVAERHRTAQRFAAPGPAERPWLRWWWPGGAVRLDALCQQLRGFAEAGFGGVEIQPVTIGLPQGLPTEAVHEVFTPPWFSLVGQVMDEAERLGLRVDLTFGSCWPMGGGEAITPELAQQELSLAWTPVRGPGRFLGRPQQPGCPQRFGARMAKDGSADPAQALPEGWAARAEALGGVEAVLALRGCPPEQGPYFGFVPLTLPDPWGVVHAPGWVDVAATVDLTDQLQPDGQLDWAVPEGDWLVVVLRRFVSDQRITAAAGRGPQLVLDHLNRAAFDAHAARVGDAAVAALARHVGRTWRGVFTDSLELPLDIPWTPDLAQQFARRRGYSIRPHLPLLLQPGWRNCFQARRAASLFDDRDAVRAQGERVRADYRQTVSELMVERHYQPLADWAARNGLQSRVQAHGAPADWLEAYGVASVPETEDLAGGAAPHFLRVARAAAHQHGRALCSGEAFCWLLEGWAVHGQQLRVRADAFFAAGIGQLVGHGASAAIATDGSPVQPWYPFAGMEIGTQLDEGNPLWLAMGPLADYMARNQVLLGQGRAEVPVAVLMPPEQFAFDGAADRLAPPAWHDALTQAGLDWDWINGPALQRCPVRDGRLCTPAQGPSYVAIVLPELHALPWAVAERLAELAAQGVAVWSLGPLPRRHAGLDCDGALDARVRSALDRAVPAAQRLSDPQALGRALRARGLPGLPWLDGQSLPQGALPAGLSHHQRRCPDGSGWLLLHNCGPDELRLALTAAAAPPEAPRAAVVLEHWDAWTGQVRAQPLGPGGPALVVPPSASCWLRWGPPTPGAQPPLVAMPATGQGCVRVLHGPWTLSLQGERLGAQPLRAALQLPQLASLSGPPPAGLDEAAALVWPDLSAFAGQMRYEGSFALHQVPSGQAWLDLGQVADVAEVWLNGQRLGTWSEGPFRVAVDGHLRTGINALQVLVANRPENARRDPVRPGGIPVPGRRLRRLPTGLLGPVTLQVLCEVP